jgi:RNA polymerase sigma-70 factor (ECF subfamily)
LKLKKLHIGGLSDMTDDELVSRYKSTSDQKWLAMLFSRYLHLIYGICLRYTPDTQEAEDFTHGIYERLVDKVKSQDIKRFRNWLYMLSKNYCLEQIRKFTGKANIEFESHLVQFDQSVHPIEENENEKRFIQLEKCIDKLNIHQKNSIRLFYYKNKSYAEISGIMNQDIGMIRSHLQNGRRNLKNCMDK